MMLIPMCACIILLLLSTTHPLSNPTSSFFQKTPPADPGGGRTRVLRRIRVPLHAHIAVHPRCRRVAIARWAVTHVTLLCQFFGERHKIAGVEAHLRGVQGPRESRGLQRDRSRGPEGGGSVAITRSTTIRSACKAGGWYPPFSLSEVLVQARCGSAGPALAATSLGSKSSKCRSTATLISFQCRGAVLTVLLAASR